MKTAILNLPPLDKCVRNYGLRLHKTTGDLLTQYVERLIAKDALNVNINPVGDFVPEVMAARLLSLVDMPDNGDDVTTVEPFSSNFSVALRNAVLGCIHQQLRAGRKIITFDHIAPFLDTALSMAKLLDNKHMGTMWDESPVNAGAAADAAADATADATALTGNVGVPMQVQEPVMGAEVQLSSAPDPCAISDDENELPRAVPQTSGAESGPLQVRAAPPNVVSESRDEQVLLQPPPAKRFKSAMGLNTVPVIVPAASTTSAPLQLSRKNTKKSAPKKSIYTATSALGGIHSGGGGGSNDV